MERKGNNSSRLLEVGEKAPGFSLPDQDQHAVRLEDFAGKSNVVLVFYPHDHTPVCTRQLCTIRDDYELFEGKDVVVLGINNQLSSAHAGFAGKHSFPFKLLADPEKKVIAAYGCRGLLTTKRTVYGINKEGFITFAGRGKPSNAEILKAFEGG